MKEKLQKGIIAKDLSEAFKGLVQTEEIRFPKNLGMPHPFDFEIVEGLYKTFPFVKGAVDKHVDFIVSDFSVKVKNDNVRATIEKFIQDISLQVILKQWVTSALITGNGFLELDLENNQIRVLDPKTMYVRRRTNGKIIGYRQYKGNLGKYNSLGNEPIDFSPDKIAHLMLNKISDEAYGLGIVWPCTKTIDKLIQNDNDLHKLISRKAGAPIHVKVGIPGEAVNQEAIDSFNSDLKVMNNRTEWVSDANVDMKVLDFGTVGEKFTSTMDYDINMLYFGFQVPAVLMGVGNIPEGLAKTQMEAFQRRIRSYQEEIEKVIEEKIFKPVLLSQGNKQFLEHVDIVWSLPSDEEINKRVTSLTALLNSNSAVSENMRRMIELEIADALGIENAQNFLRKPEVGLDEERERELKIQQPEVPGAKPSASERWTIKSELTPIVLKECSHEIKENTDMTVQEWVNLQETKTIKYSDYLVAVLNALKRDSFKKLKALSESEIEMGLLPDVEIDKLRTVLKDAFKKNLTMSQIAKNIADKINLTDRYTINENGEKVLALGKESRPENIARTETVRLANEGLLDTYKDNNIQKVQFLSALSERTCEECAAKNGEIYNLTESYDVIPVHSMCRCSWIGVVE